MAPNMAIPARNPQREADRKSRLAKRESGRIGSSERFSRRRNRTRKRRESPSMPKVGRIVAA